MGSCPMGQEKWKLKGRAILVCLIDKGELKSNFFLEPEAIDRGNPWPLSNSTAVKKRAKFAGFRKIHTERVIVEIYS